MYFMVLNILTMFILSQSATKLLQFIFHFSCSQTNWNRLPKHYDFNGFGSTNKIRYRNLCCTSSQSVSCWKSTSSQCL